MSAVVSGRILAVQILREQDVVTARQRARQLAELLGYSSQEQIRIATAVSEIARNAYQYGGGGIVEFSVESSTARRELEIVVRDEGPGIVKMPHVLDGAYRSETGMGLGIRGAGRLMDSLRVVAGNPGTRVVMTKALPKNAALTASQRVAIAGELTHERTSGPFQELVWQNQELIRTLDELRDREAELRRLNDELEDTNRGVVALYAELDERAVSLRRADEVKTRFLSHMSHEFRTPLNSILALAKLLESQMDGPLSPEQGKQIGYIRSAAQDLADTVNDLLDIARVEAGHVTLRIGEFTVPSLFGALRGMMRPLRSNDSVALVFDEIDGNITLRTDEAKVAQILRNLIANALKFTERGEVRVTAAVRYDGMLFRVKDTGVGIDPAQQERVFNEFAQVENPMQRSVRGTGLGLSVSRKLAEVLGGTLKLESVVGVGSTFEFRLPHTALAGGKDGRTRAGAAEGGQVTVLVVDDEEVSRYLIRQALKDVTVMVIEAADGMTGLERARFDRPELILLDLNMPAMNGFEVLEQLRSDPELGNLPVIIYTSRELNEAERTVLTKHGATILLKYQTDAAQLTSMVRQQLAKTPEV